MADISLLPTTGQLSGLTAVQKINEALTSLNEANRLGIPAWSSTTSYGAGALTWDAGQTYKSTVANSGQRPSTTPASWVSWGLTLSDLQNGYETMADATGTAGAYAASYWPAITGLSDGQRLRFKVSVANPGACTLAVNAIPAAPIVGLAGSALQGGELTASGVATVAWSSTRSAFVLLSCDGGALQVTDGTKSHHAATLGQVQAIATQPGEIRLFAMTGVPDGFLEANGSAISRTAYAALFAAIGTTYGAGNGSTTFNIPDMRGEFPRGWDHGRGADPGRTFGSGQGHQFEDHDHKLLISSGAGSGYVVSISPSQAGREALFFVNAPGSGSHGSETRPRNLALLYCIKY